VYVGFREERAGRAGPSATKGGKTGREVREPAEKVTARLADELLANGGIEFLCGGTIGMVCKNDEIDLGRLAIGGWLVCCAGRFNGWRFEDSR